MLYTQKEIESRISDTVPHGLRRTISRITHIYESIVDAYFNPNDERKSPQFSTLLIQFALDKEDPAVGDAHWEVVCEIREELKTGLTPTQAEKLFALVERSELNLSEVKGQLARVLKEQKHGG